MSKNNKFPAHVNDDFDLARLFRILNRRKWIILITFVVFTSLAFIYVTFTKPVYEAKVIMKKEKTEKTNSTPDDITKIINQQSPAEIETEVELVKTLETMTNVINRLMLFATVDKIIEHGRITEINSSILDYSHNYSMPNFPQFHEIKLNSVTDSYTVIIQKEDSAFKMLDAVTGAQMAVSTGSDTVNFTLPSLSVKFSWRTALYGDQVQLNLADIYSTRKKLSSNINVDQKPKTDVFDLTVKSSSPFSAKEIANTMSDCFREARINQQKQTIRYSYEFVEKN
ncbi:MAG: Wzz/FepE/Etk N-terminal domain-containing protein, partial [Bacteroidota bacterium]|nr:Wzz/FepE/Etk N-terminal domain-containing protein [Bacteroidota bacterium]